MKVSPVKLKELREDQAYSIRELAELAGVHYNTIHRIEHGQGNVHPRTLRKLAEALGVKPKELRG
jgi:transcriptional regulator with XRE-family HTH domain